MYRTFTAGLSALLLILLTGCSTIYTTTGWFAYDYSEEYAMPYMLKSDDAQLGCAMGEALTPGLLSFSQVTWAPDRLATMMYMQAGSCVDARANAEGLAYIRAYKAQNIGEAKDARIRQKRLHAIAASRQYKAYKHLVAEFGEPGEECPSLSDDDELFWMLGLVSGLQAVMSDVRAQGEVGVPKDIAMKAVRGSRCLDSKKWWGVPMAMQAAVWTMLPDRAPRGVDPWYALSKASDVAARSGVRLAQAIEVTIADGSGNQDRLRDAIRRHAKSVKTQKPKHQYRMLDLIAQQQVLAISDRLWTEATGSRTPIGGLGSFWDDALANQDGLDINDLLED